MRTLDEWTERFGGAIQKADGAEYFEIYGQDLEVVKAADPRCVWTVVDCDGYLLLNPGFQFVNRMSYVIAPIPLPPEEEDQWWEVDWEDDPDHELDMEEDPEFDPDADEEEEEEEEELTNLPAPGR